MPSWLAVVVVIVVVLAFGMLRERRRLTGLEKLLGARGLRFISPFPPAGEQPFDRLAGRLGFRFTRRWGVGVEGEVGEVRLTIAEHEMSRTGSGNPDRWYTLAAWPVPGTVGPLVVWCGGGDAGKSEAGVEERLGLVEADPKTLRLQAAPGVLVEAEASVRDAWLTDARIRALAASPHSGGLLLDSGYAAWRVPGLLTPAQLELVLGQLPQLCKLIE